MFDTPMPTIRTVDPTDSIGTIVFLIGVFVRIATSRKYVNAYTAAYGSAPPRSWLTARDPDPTVERARLPLALGTLIAMVGFGIFVAGLLSG